PTAAASWRRVEVGALRGAARALGVLVVSLLCGLAGLVLGLPRLLGPRGDRLALRSGLGLPRLRGRAMLALVGVRLGVDGRPPREPCVIVGNHLSYLDIALLGSQRRMRFVAGVELARWPFFGQLAWAARVVFLERARHKELLRVGEEIRKSLDAGVSVVF